MAMALAQALALVMALTMALTMLMATTRKVQGCKADSTCSPALK